MPLPNTLAEHQSPGAVVEPFSAALARHHLRLVRGETSTLQVNVGLLCNQVCRHCHLEAGPARPEVMTAQTVCEVVRLAERHRFACIDITGGAPELNPHLPEMLARLAALTPRLMLRSNLTALASDERWQIIMACIQHQVVIVASLPALSESQTDSQRGQGVFARSLASLRQLNSLGYGRPGTGLELNLVSNPTGAFLPPAQQEQEKRFRELLQSRWGIEFNHLFTFANVPLGRFARWLVSSGNYQGYLQRLAASFNQCTVESLMCRTGLSISWDGFVFDCDFNQAVGLFSGGRKTHIAELRDLPAPGTTIPVADHCYTCTAGAGFT